MAAMSRFAWVSQVAPCIFVAGCWSQSCPPATCPTATFNVRALEDSTVTWSFKGSPPQTTTGFVSTYPPPGTDCSFYYSGGQIVRPVDDRSTERLLQGYFDVRCGGGADGGFDFVFSKLGDIRDWPAGTFTMVAPTGSFGMDYFGSSAANDCNGVAAEMEGVVMTVTVESAAGSRAPYPQLVSGDFVRTFRLEFDTSNATSTSSGGESCDFPIVAQVSLHLAQTAADYVFDADAPCVCE